jgi:hypothetical protein
MDSVSTSADQARWIGGSIVAALPGLFDILIFVLLVGGFRLLWVNLWERREHVLPTVRGGLEAVEAEQKANSIAPEPKTIPVEMNPTLWLRSTPPELLKTEAVPEVSAIDGVEWLSVPPAQEPDARADVTAAEHNHYASSVSAAIARSRKPPSST